MTRIKATIRETLHNLRRGMWTLRIISTAAPLLGLFGTTYGFVSGFPFMGCYSCSNPVAHILETATSELLPITALGLVVGVLAQWIHGYCLAQTESLEQQMRIVALEHFGCLPRPRQAARYIY